MTVFQIDSAQEKSPRAYLVCVSTSRITIPDAPEELTELVRSDALEPVGMMLAKRDKPDPATYLGSGKIQELADELKRLNVGVVVFDVALSAAQQRNIERTVGVAVLDRTQLILEIFQRRAKSREGRLQVELARLEHLSTRLVRGWTHLERQRGGLGKTGGPGEKQIELDRRMIGVRVKQLKEQLKKLQKQRNTQRKGRSRSDIVSLSIVGYTNAGKSTLFNALTKSDIYAADQLFATLDTTARRCYVGDGESVVLSDTVGFIRGLPHQLVEAFKSTLDETVHADILLHVVDASSPAKDDQIVEVNKVLEEIDAHEIPTILVLNKIDQTDLEPEILRNTNGEIEAVRISALKSIGLDLLREAILERSREIKEANKSLPREPEEWEMSED
ncbi:GTPase HflX [Parasutterella secunda]|uniref:GTPase HflX n=1 Tax=Parasutterella secunda TaxID=626947 RepID=A0ABS2GSX1_9BURK|nr:GTPase HflX [Parasutterella secunda]MBM6928898.1 GTPase HflX [Parasutterella secunda]